MSYHVMEGEADVATMCCRCEAVRLTLYSSWQAFRDLDSRPKARSGSSNVFCFLLVAWRAGPTIPVLMVPPTEHIMMIFWFLSSFSKAVF